MKRSILLSSLVILALVASSGCTAASPLSVTGARSNVCPAGENCGVYLTIANSGGTSDTLVGAAADVAMETGLHTVVTDAQGNKVMTPIEDIPVPASGSAELKPGSLHIMLMSLKRDLKEGETFPLTLKFQQAADITLQVLVHAIS